MERERSNSNPVPPALRNSQEILHNSVLSIGAKMGAYVWLTDEQFVLNDSKGILTFEAKAANDIHLSIEKDLGTRRLAQDGLMGPMYEIVIGGWMNSKTAIRKYGQQKAYATKRSNQEASIRPVGGFCSYWFIFNNGLLIYGKGDIPGKNEVLRWQDDTPDNSGRRYIGFSSWDAPIQFRNVKITSDVYITQDKVRKEFSPAHSLVNHSSLSDLVFKIEGQLVYAHRAIVACASQLLWDRINEGNCEDKETGVLIHSTDDKSSTTIVMEKADIPPREITDFLLFLYGAKVPYSSHLLKLTEQFKIPMGSGIIQTKSGIASIHRPTDFSKLLFSPLFSDVTFIVEDQRLPCHRPIVSLTSEHFFAMFNRQFKESWQDEIAIHDVTVSSFKLLLEYLYTGNIANLNVVDAISLLDISNRFWIHALKNLTDNYLRSALTPDNCFEILHAASCFDMTNLHNACIRFIENSFEAAVKSDGFLQTDPSLLMEIILSNNLNIPREETVYEALMSWGDADRDNRDQYLQKLLSYLRFPVMDKEYIEKNIQPNALFASGILAGKINEALRYLSEESKDESKVKIVEDCFVVNESDYLSTPRRNSNFVELLFSFCGDESGVFYWLGTNHRTKRWANPLRAGFIKITCSSPMSRYTKPDVLVNRQFQSRNYTVGKPPWWQIDLSEEHRLICNYYSLHHDGSPSYLRDWILQGSNDEANWLDLRVHKNDETIHFPGQQAAWSVVGKISAQPYRFFRIIMTDAAADGSNNLSLCGIELYGHYL